MSRALHFLGRLALGAAATSLATAAALAGDHPKGPKSRAPLMPQYREECGSCHVAYPPRMLPADSWRQLMGELSRHFGTDASLDAAAKQSIEQWLLRVASAPRRSLGPAPENRITRTGWFVHEHRKVPAAAWRGTAVKSASNCGACHAGADHGEFDEHNVRIPR